MAILDRLRSMVSAIPFGGEPHKGIAPPPPAWASDQAPVRPLVFDPQYHSHTFQSFSAPLSFDGFDLARVRNAVSLHRQGYFLESSMLSLVIPGFAPVFAALSQRVSPWRSLRKHMRGGVRGMSRIVREELERQICPNYGQSGSIYFPVYNWGQMAYDKVLMGFAVLQHAYGEPDPVTGVRPVFTRPWPTWATQYYRYRRTFVALTTDGPVDILNDGKFTLVADTQEPHFFGAITVLGEETFDGKQTQRARASYIERYGNPKWIGTMPEGQAPNTPEGQLLLDVMKRLRAPDSVAILPHGATADQKGLEGGRGGVMAEALASNIWAVAATVVGSDGTISRGSGGVYSAPVFAGVRRDLAQDDMTTIVRGVMSGAVDPYLEFNYAETRKMPSWVDPYLDIPLPDPDRDARIDGYGRRVAAYHRTIVEERAAGFVVDQERADRLAESFEIDAPILTDPTGRTFPVTETADVKPVAPSSASAPPTDPAEAVEPAKPMKPSGSEDDYEEESDI